MVELLCEEIKDNYDSVSKNVVLMQKKKNRQRNLIEIDIVAKKGKWTDIYEVKCSNRRVKAKKQLKNAKKFLKLDEAYTNFFFYCGESRKLEEIIL